MNLDDSIRFHQGKPPVPSPFRPHLNLYGPQISHMLLLTQTHRQTLPLLAFPALGHKQWPHYLSMGCKKNDFIVFFGEIAAHILAIARKLLAVNLHRLASSHSFDPWTVSLRDCRLSIYPCIFLSQLIDRDVTVLFGLLAERFLWNENVTKCEAPQGCIWSKFWT